MSKVINSIGFQMSNCEKLTVNRSVSSPHFVAKLPKSTVFAVYASFALHSAVKLHLASKMFKVKLHKKTNF